MKGNTRGAQIYTKSTRSTVDDRSVWSFLKLNYLFPANCVVCPKTHQHSLHKHLWNEFYFRNLYSTKMVEDVTAAFPNHIFILMSEVLTYRWQLQYAIFLVESRQQSWKVWLYPEDGNYAADDLPKEVRERWCEGNKKSACGSTPGEKREIRDYTSCQFYTSNW